MFGRALLLSRNSVQNQIRAWHSHTGGIPGEVNNHKRFRTKFISVNEKNKKSVRRKLHNKSAIGGHTHSAI